MSFWSSFAGHYRRVFPPRPAAVAWLARLAGERRPARVLDLGCGVGDDAAGLAADGLEVLGLDPDPGMVDQAGRLHARAVGLTFAEAGLEDFEPALEAWLGAGAAGGGELALALCVGNVAAHLGADELGGFLERLRPRLASGATLVLQTVNYDRILAVGAGARRFDFPVLEDQATADLPALCFERAYEDLDEAGCRFVTRLLADGEPVFQGQVGMVPHRADALEAALTAAGFGRVERRGGLGEAPWDGAMSGPTVLLARA